MASGNPGAVQSVIVWLQHVIVADIQLGADKAVFAVAF